MHGHTEYLKKFGGKHPHCAYFTHENGVSQKPSEQIKALQLLSDRARSGLRDCKCQTCPTVPNPNPRDPAATQDRITALT